MAEFKFKDVDDYFNELVFTDLKNTFAYGTVVRVDKPFDEKEPLLVYVLGAHPSTNKEELKEFLVPPETVGRNLDCYTYVGNSPPELAGRGIETYTTITANEIPLEWGDIISVVSEHNKCTTTAIADRCFRYPNSDHVIIHVRYGPHVHTTKSSKVELKQ